MLSKKIVEQFHNICPSERDEYQQKRPYVSSAFCQRRISASGLLPTRKIEATKALQFYGRIGDPIEQLISEIYDANEQLIISQYKLPQQLFPAGVDIGGKIDLIIEYDGEPLIIDVKTVGATEGTDYLTVTDEESKIIQNLIDTDFADADVIDFCKRLLLNPDRQKTMTGKSSKVSNEAQVQLYTAITGIDSVLMSVSRRVQDGYKPDGTISLAVNDVDTSEKTLIMRIAVLLLGIKARENGVLAPKLKGITKTSCSDSFCPFIDFCWNGAERLDMNLNITLKDMSEEDIKKYSKECLEIATEYVKSRHERRELAIELIKQEKKTRQAIEYAMNADRQKWQKEINEFGLYPWQLKMEVSY